MQLRKKITGALYRRYQTRFQNTGIHQYNRIPLFDRRMPFVVLWSQKAGSTTVLKWFFDKLGLLDEALRHHQFAHRYELEVYKKRPGYADDVKKALHDPNMPAIKFVRDPAARAFSGYLVLCAKAEFESTEYPRHYWRGRLIKWLYGSSGDVDARVSFMDYLKWLAQENSSFLDGHLAPQYTDIEKELDDRLIIYRVEDLPDAFTMVEQRFGLTSVEPAQLDRIMQSDHHYRKDDSAGVFETVLNEGVNMPVRRNDPMPKVTTSMLQSYPEAMGLVQACFAKDYRAYGYDPA